MEALAVTFTITQPCIDTMDQSCVEVCPVDCIHFEEGADRMLYISPVECIDCGACQPACPVTAIFPEDDVPADQIFFTEINALWFEDAAAARAKVPADGGVLAPAATEEVAVSSAATDTAAAPSTAPVVEGNAPAAASPPAEEPAVAESPAPVAEPPTATAVPSTAPPQVKPHAAKQDYKRAFAGFHYPISRDAVIRGASDKGGVDREVAAILGRLARSRFGSLDELQEGVREVYLSLGVDQEQLPI